MSPSFSDVARVIQILAFCCWPLLISPMIVQACDPLPAEPTEAWSISTLEINCLQDFLQIYNSNLSEHDKILKSNNLAKAIQHQTPLEEFLLHWIFT